jgi:hypothetical protein
MIDSAYIYVVLILVCIFLIYIYTRHGSLKVAGSAKYHKYIKKQDDVVSIPHHMLETILARYRTMLIDCCNSRANAIDDSRSDSVENDHFGSISAIEHNLNLHNLRQIQNALAMHIKIKYGVKYNLYPDQLEKYIIDQGVKQTNKYDAELIGGIDLTDKARALGIIIWYIEQLVLHNKNNPDTIEIPLCLDDLDRVIDHTIYANKKAYSSVATKYLDTLPDGIEVELPADRLDLYGMHDLYGIRDAPDPTLCIRKPLGCSPKECSSILRNNTRDYLSDNAAQPVHRENLGAGNVYYKYKNAKEAKSNWRNINHSRLADISHLSDPEFGDSDNRDLGPHLSYANYDLSIGLMRRDNSTRHTSEKQSLTDVWDHLESNIFTRR